MILGLEASFRAACSETQTCQHTSNSPTAVLFTRALIYSIHNREALYIFSREEAQPELENASRSSMEAAWGKEEMGARQAEAA